MRTTIHLLAVVMILAGIFQVARAEETVKTEDFSAMKSHGLAGIASRQAKLEELKACVNKASDRRQLEVCLPWLNYGPTEVQASQQQMAAWKSKALDGIARRQTKLDEAKACITASTGPAELKQCRMELEQAKGGQQGFKQHEP